MITVKKFFASWCMPCRQLTPTFTRLKEMYPDVKFIDLDVETEDSAVSLYNIRSVPTVIIENESGIVDKIVGLAANAKYVEAINTAVAKG